MAAKLAVTRSFIDVVQTSRKMSVENIVLRVHLDEAEYRTLGTKMARAVAESKLEGLTGAIGELVELGKRQVTANESTQLSTAE